MSRATFSVFEKDELERLHQAAVNVLGETGIKVRSDKALSVLEDAGAAVDRSSQIAKVPESLISEAVRSTSREFVLGSRDGTRDLEMPAKSRPFICTDGFAIEIIDAVTGDRRKSINGDLVRFARLGDNLDALDFFWPIVNPGDFPGNLQMVRAFFTAIENTGKHVQHEALGSAVAKLQIKAASMVAGGDKELERRPLFSAVQCPVAPLMFEEGSIEAAMEFARAGIPVVYMSMPMMGGSAPITVAGAIVQGHAEVLGGLTISQLVRKGARVFHSILTGPIDMQTGVWASGSAENAIGNAGAVQLAKSIGLPSMGGGFGTCAKMPGVQAGYEKMATMVPSALVGTDIITGIGGLDDAKCMSMAQAIIDAEMWTFVMRMRRGIETSSSSLGVDAIRQVGPGGLFLKHRDTLAKFRSELWLPTLGQRQGYEEWKKAGRPDIVKRAEARASELSSLPPRNPLPKDIEKELENLFAQEGKNV
jgi:trimethylamine--corrinoid protein Co-methyltransferase